LRRSPESTVRFGAVWPLIRQKTASEVGCTFQLPHCSCTAAVWLPRVDPASFDVGAFHLPLWTCQCGLSRREALRRIQSPITAGFLHRCECREVYIIYFSRSQCMGSSALGSGLLVRGWTPPSLIASGLVMLGRVCTLSSFLLSATVFRGTDCSLPAFPSQPRISPSPVARRNSAANAVFNRSWLFHTRCVPRDVHNLLLSVTGHGVQCA